MFYSQTLLFQSFNYLKTNLSNAIIEKNCSISARSLLLVNKQVLSKNKSELLSFYDSFNAQILKNKNYQSILNGIVEVICYGDNATEIQCYLVEIMTMWVRYFSEAKTKSELSQEGLTKSEVYQISEVIKVFKIIIQSAYESLSNECMVILTGIFKELWPMIKFFLIKYLTDKEISECCIQLIKCFMRGIKSDFKPYLEEYILIIIKGYKDTAIPSYLYGFEVLVTVFNNDKSVYQILNNVFYEFVSFTFSKYIRTQADLEENIDLAQDFFGLLYRIINLYPLIVFNSVLFDQLFSFTVMNISIGNVEIAKNIITFTSKVINFREMPFINELDPENKEQLIKAITEKINKHCDILMAQILTTFTQVPPQSITEYLKTLFFRCVQYFPESTYNSFSKCLVNLPSDCLTDKEKKVFMSYIVKDFIEKKLDDEIDKLIHRCYSKTRRAANRDE